MTRRLERGLESFLDAWEEHGPNCMDWVATFEPLEFLKLAAKILPHSGARTAKKTHKLDSQD
ncbi:MAG: hypothetical protein O7D91_16915 [Planctomycetota bacterium]|nr:hypothetical protein [Planctomycetota bacterium]